MSIVPPKTSFTPVSSSPHPAHSFGEQHKYKFPNGYGASVIRSPYSYGGEQGLWELAVLGVDGKLTYRTHITSDVEGWLDDDGVDRLLNQISSLPAGDSGE